MCVVIYINIKRMVQQFPNSHKLQDCCLACEKGTVGISLTVAAKPSPQGLHGWR